MEQQKINKILGAFLSSLITWVLVELFEVVFKSVELSIIFSLANLIYLFIMICMTSFIILWVDEDFKLK